MHEPMEGSVALLETTYERHVAHLCCFIALRAALMAVMRRYAEGVC